MINKELQEETNKELMVLATMLGFEVRKTSGGIYIIVFGEDYLLTLYDTVVDTQFLGGDKLNLPSKNSYMQNRRQRYNFVKDYLILARKRINESE